MWCFVWECVYYLRPEGNSLRWHIRPSADDKRGKLDEKSISSCSTKGGDFEGKKIRAAALKSTEDLLLNNLHDEELERAGGVAGDNSIEKTTKKKTYGILLFLVCTGPGVRQPTRELIFGFSSKMSRFHRNNGGSFTRRFPNDSTWKDPLLKYPFYRPPVLCARGGGRQIGSFRFLIFQMLYHNYYS